MWVAIVWLSDGPPWSLVPVPDRVCIEWCSRATECQTGSTDINLDRTDREAHWHRVSNYRVYLPCRTILRGQSSAIHEPVLAASMKK